MGGGVVGAVDFDDFTGLVLDDGLAGDEVGVAEADFGAGGEAVILLGGDLAEVVVFDVDYLGERDFASTGGFVSGVVDGFHVLDEVGGVVGDDHLERIEDGHGAEGAFVEVFAEEVFQEAEFDDAVGFGDADVGAEGAQSFGSIAAAAETGEGGHAGVVPAGHQAFLNE